MDRDAEPDPQAATAAMEKPRSPDRGDYHRDGKLLVIRDGAVLPQRCILTNQALGPGDWTKRMAIYKTPFWVWLPVVVCTLLLSKSGRSAEWVGANVLFLVLLTSIAAIFANKKVTLTYSLNRQARARLLQRRSIALLAAAAGGIAMMISFFRNEPVEIFGGALVLLGCLAVLAISNALTLRKHAKGWFSLKGCSKEFLDSL